MKPKNLSENVKVVVFKEARTAALEHRGNPDLLGHSLRKFIDWRKENRLPPRVSATFNVLRACSPDIPPEDYHMDLCAAVDHAVAENRFGVVEKFIPGGRCAVLRHVGSDDALGDAVTFLYSTWLPASGEELRDFPLYFQRVVFFPDVPEHEAITDVFLPLK